MVDSARAFEKETDPSLDDGFDGKAQTAGSSDFGADWGEVQLTTGKKPDGSKFSKTDLSSILNGYVGGTSAHTGKTKEQVIALIVQARKDKSALDSVPAGDAFNGEPITVDTHDLYRRISSTYDLSKISPEQAMMRYQRETEWSGQRIRKLCSTERGSPAVLARFTSGSFFGA
jgi:hypothetical protein